jgi:hypothetical protein
VLPLNVLRVLGLRAGKCVGVFGVFVVTVTTCAQAVAVYETLTPHSSIDAVVFVCYLKAVVK